MGRLSKEDIINYLVEKTDAPREDFESMNIAQLTKMRRDVRLAEKAAGPEGAGRPIVTPDGTTFEESQARSGVDKGMVKVGDRKVPVEAVVAYKGREVHPKRRDHQVVVYNPKTGINNLVVNFEMRPSIFKGLPVAIVEDWRARAHVLFRVSKVRVNLTQGTEQVRVHPKPDYVTPLDVNPDRAMVERMASYLRGSVTTTDENELLAQSIANTVFPGDGGK